MTTESLRAFAARKGNAVSYWHKQKELGRLVMVDVNGKPMVDVERSEALIAATADPAKSHMASVNDDQRAMHRGAVPPSPLPQEDAFRSNPTDTKNATYMQAKTARAVYEAKKSQLDLAERQGLLIEREQIKRDLHTIARELRDRHTTTARRIAAELANTSNAEACETVLLREFEQMLKHTVSSVAKLNLGIDLATSLDLA